MAHILDEDFVLALEKGPLTPLLEAVTSDRDLILEIRENYLNIYFKGQSLLCLKKAKEIYKPALHAKYLAGIPDLETPSPFDAERFVKAIPQIKENILRLGPDGSEIEYEQLIVRANNGESRVNTEYFMIDRQVATPDGKGQFDLLGFVWPGKKSDGKWSVPLALLEVKYGPNPDIKNLHLQLDKYHKALNAHFRSLAEDAEVLLRQKLRLGLVCGTAQQLAAFEQISVSKDPNHVRFGIVLVDYNPASKALDLTKLAELPFSKQIDIFHVGFGLWRANAREWTKGLAPSA